MTISLKKIQKAGMTCVAAALLQGTAHADVPKYVFYFIGDGMASPQVHATEAYLAAVEEDDAVAGGVKAKLLNMSQFPVTGMQMSFANDRFITGSAAAGTALACGMKTNIGVISMDPEVTTDYTTLAEAAKEQGMKVGVVSSVSIDHATPAVFYAHTESRNNYEEIGEDLLNSAFDYFGGGGFRVNKYSSEIYAGLSNDERYQVLEEKAADNGFIFTNTQAEFKALKEGRAIAVNPHLDSSNAMPYALNTKGNKGIGKEYQGTLSLAQFTKKGIQLMKKNPEGFFMMVEGGKIDWASHANDARSAIEDTIAFDDAIGVAVAFAAKHPDETLIVVTGDHECGGMTLGFAGTGYGTYYERMAKQKLAYDDFAGKVLSSYKEVYDGDVPTDIDKKMWKVVKKYFGLDGYGLTAETDDDLTAYEIELLEAAYDKTMTHANANSDEENTLLYGYYDPFTVTLTHLLNRKSGLTWTSFSHTAVPVPVFAQGAGEEVFTGYYDNTDVAKKIASAMGVELGN